MIFPHRYIPVALAALIGCILSSAGYVAVGKVEVGEIRAQFEQVAADRVTDVSRNIEAHLEILRSIAAFYGSSREVERDEFRSFVAPALSRRPSIQALEWVPRVDAAERDAHEAAARAEGYHDYRITERQSQGTMVPATTRATHYPVLFVEPLESNEPALGFDLGSSGARLAMLEQSRDNNQLRASLGIRLVQEKGNQYGVLAVAPIYRNGLPHGSVEARRRNLAGFALGVIRVGDMVAGAAIEVEPESILGSVALQMLLYEEAAYGGRRLLHVQHHHDADNGAHEGDSDAVPKVDVHYLPIRLTPMTATCRVPPLSRVKLGIGWSRGVARDAEQ